MQKRYGPFISLAVILSTTAINLRILWLAPPSAMVPIHFNQELVPDHIVPPMEGIIIWIGIQTGLWGVMYAIPHILRSDDGLRASITVYDTVWITLTAILGTLSIVSMEQALGIKIALNSLTDLLTGGFLIIMGNALGKLRPNALIGIRTPWTKANIRVWHKTHRTSGPVFILTGILLLAAGAGILGLPLGAYFRSSCLIVMALFTVGLSWIYSRSEQKIS